MVNRRVARDIADRSLVGGAWGDVATTIPPSRTAETTIRRRRRCDHWRRRRWRRFVNCRRDARRLDEDGREDAEGLRLGVAADAVVINICSPVAATMMTTMITPTQSPQKTHRRPAEAEAVSSRWRLAVART